jgi:choline kinase
VIRTLMSASQTASAAVEPSASLGDEEMKVRVQNGTIVQFGKQLDPNGAFGESIGIEWFAARSVEIVAQALQNALAQGSTQLYYEDVYNNVIDRLQMRAVTVSQGSWMEIDDIRDLESAERWLGAPSRG